MEAEYKKLKFDKNLGPDLDKLHKQEKEDAFLLLADKILNTVDLYQKMLKQAQLPKEIEAPLDASLKKLDTEVNTIKGDAPGIFKLEAEEQDEKLVNKGKLSPAFDLVDLDFEDDFKGHGGWRYFGGQTPDLSLKIRVDNEVVRRTIAKYNLKIAAVQDPFAEQALKLFNDAYSATVTSVLNELQSSHLSQMPPDLARSEINDLMKDYRKEFQAKLGDRLVRHFQKLKGESMDDLLGTKIFAG